MVNAEYRWSSLYLSRLNTNLLTRVLRRYQIYNASIQTLPKKGTDPDNKNKNLHEVTECAVERQMWP